MTEIQLGTVAVGNAEMNTPDSILDARVHVPQHVVYRDFVNETVVLNLETGTYHGLNRTAGLMLTTMERERSVREAAVKVAEDNGWDLATVESDIVDLCRTLAESGLIAFAGSDAAD